MTPWDTTPVDILARAIQSEAGNEPEVGQIAVGAVIDNRLRSGRWGDSLHNVILAPGQFSAFNNYTGYAGGAGGNEVWKRQPSEQAYRVAQKIIAGDYEDPTGGALNYYNPADANPKWGDDSWQRIGNHVFGTAGQPGTGRADIGGERARRSTRGQSMQQQQSPWAQIIAESQKPRSKKDRIMNALTAMAVNAGPMYRGQRMDFSPFVRGGGSSTVQWLTSQGHEDLAAAVASGVMTGKEAIGLMQSEAKTGTTTYRPLSEAEVEDMGLDPENSYQISSHGKISRIGGSGVEVNLGGPPDLTEAQSKNTFYYTMIKAALPEMAKLDAQGKNMWQSVLPTFLQSEEYRAYDNNALQIAEAVLRIETGATATEPEIERARRRLFPVPGDPPAEVERKRALRETVLNSVGIAAGEGRAFVDAQDPQATTAPASTPVPAAPVNPNNPLGIPGR